jgi:hypothetical protein
LKVKCEIQVGTLQYSNSITNGVRTVI